MEYKPKNIIHIFTELCEQYNVPYLITYQTSGAYHGLDENNKRVKCIPYSIATKHIPTLDSFKSYLLNITTGLILFEAYEHPVFNSDRTGYLLRIDETKYKIDLRYDINLKKRNNE